MLKRFIISFILSGSLYTASAVAENIKLAVPENIHILSIDGHEQPSSFFGSRAQVKTLTVGEHILSMRYSQLFDISAEDHDIVKSAPMAIRFVAESGQQYQLIVNAPKHYEEAVKFAKEPNIQLLNNQTGVSQSAVAIKSYAEASLIDTISKAFNNSDSATLSTNNTQLLQDIWLRASMQERQAFAAWLAAQAANK